MPDRQTTLADRLTEAMVEAIQLRLMLTVIEDKFAASALSEFLVVKQRAFDLEIRLRQMVSDHQMGLSEKQETAEVPMANKQQIH